MRHMWIPHAVLLNRTRPKYRFEMLLRRVIHTCLEAGRRTTASPPSPTVGGPKYTHKNGTQSAIVRVSEDKVRVAVSTHLTTRRGHQSAVPRGPATARLHWASRCPRVLSVTICCKWLSTGVHHEKMEFWFRKGHQTHRVPSDHPQIHDLEWFYGF